MIMTSTHPSIHERLFPPNPRWDGIRVLVIGLGKSGQAAVELLLHEHALVHVYDADPEQRRMANQRWGETLQSIEPHLLPMDIDCCVISPGVPPFGSFYNWLREENIPLWGEMEMACRHLDRPLITVTGTNGKTTVVHIIEHILNHCGYNTKATGNVGYPLSQAVLKENRTGNDPLVLEVSSFQCETFETFHPCVGVITNLAPDHLDRYDSQQAYYHTKFRMVMNQAPNEALWMGPRVEGDCPNWVASRRRSFALNDLGPDGLFFVDGDVIHCDGSMKERLPWPSFQRQLPQHGLNSLAALGAALSFGVPLADGLQALESFQPLPHRLEFVQDINGVHCYNDSKATNVHSLEAALRSLPAPIRLIAGGRSKGDSLEPLESLIRDKVSAAYLIGEAASQFAQAWKDLTTVHLEPSLEQAVYHALQESRPGESLLLSPACASWDMFSNYAERGDCFKRAVKEYPK